MYCKAIGCSNLLDAPGDFCRTCAEQMAHMEIATSPLITHPHQFSQKPSGLSVHRYHHGDAMLRNTDAEALQTSSGGDNDYWVAKITHPKRLEPYDAECEDLIEHFQMTFQEGEAFKALWRKGQARIGNGKPGDTPLRNAEKVAHFGARMVAMEQRELSAID